MTRCAREPHLVLGRVLDRRWIGASVTGKPRRLRGDRRREGDAAPTTVGRHAAVILLDGVNELALSVAVEETERNFWSLMSKARSVYSQSWEAPGRKGWRISIAPGTWSSITASQRTDFALPVGCRNGAFRAFTRGCRLRG